MKIFVVALLISFPCSADEQQKVEAAAKVAAEAWIKQEGIDKRVEEYVKQVVPKEVQEWIGRIGVPAQVLLEQRVEIRYEF